MRKSSDLRAGCQKVILYLTQHGLGIFAIDQSTNHNAYPTNALLASRMTLNPKVETKWTFKDGWYMRDSQMVIQRMFFEADQDGRSRFKGIKQVRDT